MTMVIGYLLLGGLVMTAIGLRARVRQARPQWWPEPGGVPPWAQWLVMLPLMLVLWPLLVLDALAARRQPESSMPLTISPDDLRQPVSQAKLEQALAKQPEVEREEVEWQAFMAMRQRGDAIWSFEQPAGERPKVLYRHTAGSEPPLRGYVLMRRGNPVAHLYTDLTLLSDARADAAITPAQAEPAPSSVEPQEPRQTRKRRVLIPQQKE
ncbi:hypothetical protein [Ferrimonas gelatinilytica]|uniref:Uncharacterized protein n=1 Tax=Ferrimonas gelatinilytica TaxID=1255257 RepID=A0ABP9S6G7_9GAMM